MHASSVGVDLNSIEGRFKSTLSWNYNWSNSRILFLLPLRDVIVLMELLWSDRVVDCMPYIFELVFMNSVYLLNFSWLFKDEKRFSWKKLWMDVFWFNIIAPQNQVICNSSVKNWHIFKMVVSAAEMRLILISITKEMQNKSFWKREQHRWLKFQNWVSFL